jgi:hypothetical protein
MTDLRNQVFYRTDTEVRTGDEFYHIALTYHPELKETPFRVQVIHGFAGIRPVDGRCRGEGVSSLFSFSPWLR